MKEDSVIAMPSTSLVERVGPYSKEEFINCVQSFHSHLAPGVIAGGIMVDMALKQIPTSVLFNAIVETSYCLPDAVQLLTPCSVGNGWLQIVDFGRFAVSLYDKDSGQGVRVYVDPAKLRRWDRIETWFFSLTPKHLQDKERLLEQIWQAGDSIYTMTPVKVKSNCLTRPPKGQMGLCRVCGESYRLKDGPICLACQGQSPYES